MKAKATRSEHVEIDISEYEISKLIRSGEYTENATMLHALERNWCAKIGYTSDPYIKDGYWWEEWEESGGSHSWTNREKRTKATEKEMEIWENFQNLRKLLRPYL